MALTSVPIGSCMSSSSEALSMLVLVRLRWSMALSRVSSIFSMSRLQLSALDFKFPSWVFRASICKTHHQHVLKFTFVQLVQKNLSSWVLHKMTRFSIIKSLKKQVDFNPQWYLTVNSYLPVPLSVEDLSHSQRTLGSFLSPQHQQFCPPVKSASTKIPAMMKFIHLSSMYQNKFSPVHWIYLINKYVCTLHRRSSCEVNKDKSTFVLQKEEHSSKK